MICDEKEVGILDAIAVSKAFADIEKARSACLFLRQWTESKSCVEDAS